MIKHQKSKIFDHKIAILTLPKDAKIKLPSIHEEKMRPFLPTASLNLDLTEHILKQKNSDLLWL